MQIVTGWHNLINMEVFDRDFGLRVPAGCSVLGLEMTNELLVERLVGITMPVFD